MKRIVTCAFFAAVALVVLPGCEKKTPRTEIMLEIDAEPSIDTAAATLSVEVFGGEADRSVTTYASRYRHVTDNPSFPSRIALIPVQAQPPRGWLVDVIVEDRDGNVVTASSIRGAYVAEHAAVARVVLQDACVGVSCDQMWCDAGACVDPAIDVTMLPELEVDGGR